MKIPNKFNRMGIEHVREALPPLTFTAIQAGSTVTLNATGSPTVSGLQYRTAKGGAWTPYTIGSTLTLTNANDIVQFQNTANALSSSGSNYVNFALTGSIAGSGNTMSLLNYADLCPKLCFFKLFFNNNSLITAPELPATTLQGYCYQYMFQACKYMTDGPSALPATNLPNYCYYYMFENCNRMKKAPSILPATTVGQYSCNYMFSYCGLLKTAPELPATTLNSNCYSGMFSNCNALTTAPSILPATTLKSNCYNIMFDNCKNLTVAPELPNITTSPSGNLALNSTFYNCSKLNSIKVGFTSWPTTDIVQWLNGTSATGTFYKPSALSEQFGANKIPSGWTVVNID